MEDGAEQAITSTTDLATQPASRKAVVGASISFALILAFAGGLLLVGTHHVSVMPGLLLIAIAAAGFMNLVTAYIFLGYFRTTQQPPILFLGAAYLLAGLVALSSLVMFPDVFLASRSFGADAQAATYLWALWHLGFLVLLCASVAVSYRKDRPQGDPLWVQFALFAVITGGTLCGAVLPLHLAGLGATLPSLVDADGFLAPARWSALALVAVAGGFILYRLIGTRKRRTTTNLWLSLAVGALALDTVVTLLCARFSFAWYGAPLLSIFSATTILGGYIRGMVKIHSALVSANHELRNLNELERRRARERLIFLAYHDELTGLHNRSRWQELLRLSVDAANEDETGNARFTVLLVDLDNFKEVNDALGHVKGDEVLVDAAARLRAALRPNDVIGRLGGDEFAILLPTVWRAEEAHEVTERLLETLRAEFVAQDRTFKLSGSIGIASYPAHGTTAEALVQHADIALYDAKREGGNCHRSYVRAMSDERERWRELRDALGCAVADSSFTLHYQPLLDLRTGLVHGAEALIRWQDPKKGMIGPVSFIGVAEQTGLMSAIGRWTLEAAAEQIDRWNRAGKLHTISVNISVTHLQDPSFFEHVCETLARNGVAAWQVRLEVTESVAMAESGSASEVLGRLDRLGIKIVLDDFGTQYSSLKYLQQLPIDTIKIDRCFVSGLPANGHDAAIVRGVIALGHDLGRTIVAEGVETREQLDWLRGADCDIVQGYFIANPMPADRFADWCESHGRSGNLVPLQRRLPVRSSA